MKKFSYRMENVLKIKRQLEEQQKIEFAIANNKLQEEKDKLIRLTIKQRKYERKAKELSEGKLDVMALNENRNAITVMKTLIREQMIQVHMAEKNVERERNKLREMQMERKTHEKLKEYAWKEYMNEFNHEEAKEIDQLVSYTYSANEN